MASLFILSVLAALAAGCAEPEPERIELPRPVVVAELRTSNPSDKYRLTGAIEAWNEEDIAFEVSGRVTYVVEAGTYLEGRWLDKDGNVVVIGDEIAAVDDGDYRSALAAARADHAKAIATVDDLLPAQLAKAEAAREQEKQEHARILEASKSRAVAQIDVIRARADLDVAIAQVAEVKASLVGAKADLARAEAALRKAELDLERTTLRAPFSGEVGEIYVEAGGYARAGDRVVHLVMLDPVKIQVTVSAETNRTIGADDVVYIHVDGSDRPLMGKVYQKATVADPATRTFSVTLISRNRKVLTRQPDDPSILRLPRIDGVMPALTRQLGMMGRLYVDEIEVLQKDERGYFVWALEGARLGPDLDLSARAFTVRRIDVIPGDDRVNQQGIYVLRELVDAGGLQYGQMLVRGAPAGMADGDSVALIQERWLMRPGTLVEVDWKRKILPAGYYVPIQAIVPLGEGRARVFVVDGDRDDLRAQPVEVTLHEPAGDVRRVEAVEAGRLTDGVRLIVEGASYVQPTEPVSIVKRLASHG